MNWTTARVTTLIKELDALDDEIKEEQLYHGNLKNAALKMEKDEIAEEHQQKIDEYMVIRSAIDTVIEFLDGREVRI